MLRASTARGSSACVPARRSPSRSPRPGERPIRFAAEGLPSGLRLDPATGRIGGSVAVPGTHAVTLTATNRHGTTTRPFKVVVGDTLALTPHMGWNSWYVWENHVTDKIMRDAADAIVTNGLADHGYQYVNIDDCWAVEPGAKEADLSRPDVRRDRHGPLQGRLRRLCRQRAAPFWRPAGVERPRLPAAGLPLRARERLR